MMTMKKRPPLTEQLRQAMETSGQTRYAISKATGISAVTLCRFASGERGLSMEALNALAEHLGLRLVADKSRKAKGK
jgi:hypothetical protein